MQELRNIIEEDRGGCGPFQGFVAKRKGRKKGEDMRAPLPMIGEVLEDMDNFCFVVHQPDPASVSML